MVSYNEGKVVVLIMLNSKGSQRLKTIFSRSIILSRVHYLPIIAY